MDKNQTIHEMRLEYLKQFKKAETVYMNVLAECDSPEEEAYFDNCKNKAKNKLLFLILALADVDVQSPDFKHNTDY